MTQWHMTQWHMTHDTMTHDTVPELTSDATRHTAYRIPVNRKSGIRGNLTQSSTVFWFSTKLINFSANFGSLNVKIRNIFKTVIFIACKWCKICRFYHLSPTKRKNMNGFWLNIWFTLFCLDLKFVVIYTFLFPPNLYTPNFRFHQKKGFFQVWHSPPRLKFRSKL